MGKCLNELSKNLVIQNFTSSKSVGIIFLKILNVDQTVTIFSTISPTLPILPPGRDCYILVDSKLSLKCLEGHGIQSVWPIFKTKMLIFQSKANLDERTLFGKITHL